MKIQLRPAYAWDCESCGCANFENGLIPEMSDDDLAEMRDEHGIQPWEAGNFIEMPSAVTCPQCGAEFETERDSG